MKYTFKDILKLIGLYALIYIICSAMFVGLFHTPILKGYDVLMYKGIGFIIVTGIIAAVLMGICRKLWSKVEIKDIIMMFVIFCCVNMVFLTLVPVTVERSVSVFMLSYMDTYSDRTYTEEQVAEIFVEKYVNEYGAFEKRFDEQLTTGTIVQNADGTYSITDKGRFIVKMFRAISDVFETDKRLVEP